MATNTQIKASSKNTLEVSRGTKLKSPEAETRVLPQEVISAPDPQVKTTRHYTPRRAYDPAYKARILAAYDSCTTASARGELLRKEGLYHSRVSSWRHEQAAGKLIGHKQKKGMKNPPRLDHLLRENEHLKKKLAQAEAIIDLQKKVSELLGTHILPHESSEVNS
jgi:transposase-like protein